MRGPPEWLEHERIKNWVISYTLASTNPERGIQQVLAELAEGYSKEDIAILTAKRSAIAKELYNHYLNKSVSLEEVKTLLEKIKLFFENNQIGKIQSTKENLEALFELGIAQYASDLFQKEQFTKDDSEIIKEIFRKYIALAHDYSKEKQALYRESLVKGLETFITNRSKN